MDFSQIGLDDIVAALPIVALLGGALGWLGRAYQQERASSRQARLESRDDSRDDFKAVTDAQANQIKQLQETVAYLRGIAKDNEARILDLTRENGAQAEKLASLEARLERRELCPLAREGRCPLGMVAVKVAARE